MPRAHENYGQSRARKTWKPIRACDPWDARTNLNLLRCCGHMQTGGLRIFYGFSTVFWRRGHRAWEHPYDHCTWSVWVPVMAVYLLHFHWRLLGVPPRQMLLLQDGTQQQPLLHPFLLASSSASLSLVPLLWCGSTDYDFGNVFETDALAV